MSVAPAAESDQICISYVGISFGDHVNMWGPDQRNDEEWVADKMDQVLKEVTDVRPYLHKQDKHQGGSLEDSFGNKI